MRMPLARSRSIALACTVLVAASCGGTVGSAAPSIAGGAPAPGGAPASAADATDAPLARADGSARAHGRGRPRARAEGVPRQPRPFPPGRLHRRRGDHGPGGDRDQHRGPRRSHVRQPGRLWRHRDVRPTVHLTAPYPRRNGGAPYRVDGPGTAHLGPVLRRMGRRAQRDVRRGALRPDADRRVRRR